MEALDLLVVYIKISFCPGDVRRVELQLSDLLHESI